MDILSYYYFSELAKDLHMTHTANRLFISQQTLSNHIMRLEDYYETELFYRKPKLSLTYAGEVVLDFAHKLNREHTDLQDMISDIKKEERGVMRFGASRLRMSTCLPEILPAFSERYPQIELRMTDNNTSELEPMILAGDLDLAITMTGSENPELTRHQVFQDQIYLCISDSLIEKYYGDRSEYLKKISIKGVYVENFARLPYCMLSNHMGKSIQKCFDRAKIKPNIYTVSSYIQISTLIALKGVAACFSSQTALMEQRNSIPEDLNIFPVYYENAPLMEQVYLVHYMGRYLPNYCRFFENLIKEYYEKMESYHPEKIAAYVPE